MSQRFYEKLERIDRIQKKSLGEVTKVTLLNPRTIPQELEPFKIYVACPSLVYSTDTYYRFLSIIKSRYPNATLLEPRFLFGEPDRWRALWPLLCPKVDIVVFTTYSRYLGYIGRGTYKEITDALKLKKKVLYVHTPSRLWHDTFSFGEKDSHDWRLHITVQTPTEGVRVQAPREEEKPDHVSADFQTMAGYLDDLRTTEPTNRKYRFLFLSPNRTAFSLHVTYSFLVSNISSIEEHLFYYPKWKIYRSIGTEELVSFLNTLTPYFLRVYQGYDKTPYGCLLTKDAQEALHVIGETLRKEGFTPRK